MGLGGVDTRGVHADDRGGLEIDQFDVVAVVGLVVAAVGDDALGADRVVVGDEQIGDRGIVDDGADLLLPELAGGVVRGLVGQLVGERLGVEDTAELPALLVRGAAFLLGCLERQLGVRAVRRAATGLPRQPASFRVVGLLLGAGGVVERGVAGGDAVVRRPLEHEQLVGLLGDVRDRLDARRAGADHPYPLAVEVDAVVGPVRGVEDVAGEGVEAVEVGGVGVRQRTRGDDEEARRDDVAAVGADGPAQRLLVEGRGRDAGVELDVAAQIEAIGDVLEVGEDLRLGGVLLAPVPFLLELRGERVRVVHGLDVAAGAGVAVPVPDAADAGRGLEGADRQTLLTEPVYRVESRDARADHDDVERSGGPQCRILSVHENCPSTSVSCRPGSDQTSRFLR
ncbi:Uncharacterised protein [Prescottella equi]|nr:Uncharacterised protein [Prescottella equi]